MIRTFTLISALALFTACANVGEELQEVPPAMTDQDGTWEDARREMSDVIDEMGDTFDKDKRVEIELELDRQLQEIEDGLNSMGDNAEKDIAESDFEVRMDELQEAADKARRDLEQIPDAASEAWKDASHEAASAIETLERETNEFRENVEGK